MRKEEPFLQKYLINKNKGVLLMILPFYTEPTDNQEALKNR
jgi:hypothetical protein